MFPLRTVDRSERLLELLIVTVGQVGGKILTEMQRAFAEGASRGVSL